MQTIEDRLASLERGMWVWKIVAGVLAVAIVGVYLVGAGPTPAQPPQKPGAKAQTPPPAAPPQPAVADTIQAKHFEVVSDGGKVLARLEGTEVGARIQFFSASGKVIAEGGSSTDGGSQFAVYDDADNPADMARISVAREEADLVAEDKHGKAQLSTGTAPGEAGETPRGVSILEHGRIVWQARGDRR
jgi:hypothetical protein